MKKFSTGFTPTTTPCASCCYHVIQSSPYTGGVWVAQGILNTAGVGQHTRKWRTYNLVVTLPPGTNCRRSRPQRSHRWKFLYCTHSEKVTFNIISRWDFVCNMTKHYQTWKKLIGYRQNPSYNVSLSKETWKRLLYVGLGFFGSDHFSPKGEAI